VVRDVVADGVGVHAEERRAARVGLAVLAHASGRGPRKDEMRAAPARPGEIVVVEALRLEVFFVPKAESSDGVEEHEWSPESAASIGRSMHSRNEAHASSSIAARPIDVCSTKTQACAGRT
jgi:hypothetical protein